MAGLVVSPRHYATFLVVTVVLVMARLSTFEARMFHHCQHEAPTAHQLKYAAVANTDARINHEKREAKSEFQPIRIKPFFDSSVEDLSIEKQSFVKQNAIQYVIEFLQKALTVRPLQGKILFQRDCNGNSTPFLNPHSFCSPSEGCMETSKCGGLMMNFSFPEEHLAACRMCDANGTNCQITGQDGEGVTDADFVLYVAAKSNYSVCGPNSTTLGFAVPCQLERQFDRPIAGFINICIRRAFHEGIYGLRSLLIHEITHSLVFSRSLYAFFRDANGNPLTARGPDGLPKKYEAPFFIPDETTIAKKAVRRTTFPNGTFSYMVEFFVTPALMREGRKFYGCETFPGVPLEDASRKGTGGSHFEKRVFNNELMTGSMGSTGGIISSFTLALYEDSGWYKPNYEMAEPFRWGKNEGCSFTEEGCLSPETLALKPLFCSDLTQYPLYALTRFLKMGNVFRELGGNSSCHYDRGSIGGCNSYNHTRELDPDIQYFSDPMVGGSNLLADSCPFKSGWISCKRPRDPHLSMNTFSETHGSHSKCVEFTIDTKWTRRNRTNSPIHGGGCYEVFCDEASGPILAVLGTNFSCTKGKEIHIITNNLPDFSNAVTIVCPPCEDLCWDNLNACKSLLATPTVSTGLRVSNTIITIAAVLFSITSLMLVLAIGAAVIAGVLFWKWRRAINFYQKQ